MSISKPLVIPGQVRETISERATDLFLRLARFDTMSSSEGELGSRPSTDGQYNLLVELSDDLSGRLGLVDVQMKDRFVYGTLPATRGYESAEPFTLIAHVDTAPDAPGDGVEPRVVVYDGNPISYPEDPNLFLTEDDDPLLREFRGEEIVVASGRTLLGADDKAGVAEILMALHFWNLFPDFPHGEVRVVFTSDEEIGRGVSSDGGETLDLDRGRLTRNCYTLDSSQPGALETECFDAWKVTVRFTGIQAHPGYGKGVMVNPLLAAAEFVRALPADQMPENVCGRQGFNLPYSVKGGLDGVEVVVQTRDFNAESNLFRKEEVGKLARRSAEQHPGVTVEVESDHLYPNMATAFEDGSSSCVTLARQAIEDTEGLTVTEEPIRGGTDGSALILHGILALNVMSGARMIHSKREWVGVRSLRQAVEMVLHLGYRYATASGVAPEAESKMKS